MHSASVGFQCPHCVAEGQRTQRQARTMGGGLVPSDVGRATMVLIGVNLVVWLAVVTTGGGGIATEPPSRSSSTRQCSPTPAASATSDA